MNSLTTEDSLATEDIFAVIVLLPNEDVKKTIADIISPFIHYRSDYYEDTLNIKIECYTRWEPSRNDDPFLIKINEIDTSWFYLTINEGESTEAFTNWDKRKDRPILRNIKAILDTASFSICCLNFDDISPQFILSNYSDDDSIALTMISFTIRLSNGKYIEYNEPKNLDSSCK